MNANISPINKMPTALTNFLTIIPTTKSIMARAINITNVSVFIFYAILFRFSKSVLNSENRRPSHSIISHENR